MKKNILHFCVVLAVTAFYSCKKDEIKEMTPIATNELGQDSIPSSMLNMVDESFPQLSATGNFKIIAGKLDASAQVDGNGKKARFLSPQGVFVNLDGSLLVADFNGDIRKITHDTVVSTVHIPTDPDGFTFAGGTDVASTMDGTIMVVAEQEYWLYSNGVSHFHGFGGHNEVGMGVDRDPSGKYFWFTDFTGILAVKPSGETVPTQPLYSNQLGGFTSMSASNNGVKYFASTSQLYKYTKSGVSAQIFKNFTFTDIRSVASTRDGFKVYVVDRGDIKAISNNSVGNQTIKTILSGANVVGIGLSNSEKYLYFTARNTLNKLKL